MQQLASRSQLTSAVSCRQPACVVPLSSRRLLCASQSAGVPGARLHCTALHREDRASATVSASTKDSLYEEALELARAEAFDDARQAFEHLLTRQPHICKAWVSWAQMEKRCHRSTHADRWQRCRTVLQRGLTLNPSASCLIQAWGLMELQRGNVLAAVMLLERCAKLDVRCMPVLRWEQFKSARKTVGSRGRRVGRQQQQA